MNLGMGRFLREVSKANLGESFPKETKTNARLQSIQFRKAFFRQNFTYMPKKFK